MQKGEWLVPGQLGTIKYEIRLKDGSVRVGQLRFTVSQSDRFNALSKEGEKESPRMEQLLTLSEIALNPDHENPEWSKEEIKEAFDLDELNLLTHVWIQRKVVGPSLSRETDPKWF